MPVNKPFYTLMCTLVVLMCLLLGPVAFSCFWSDSEMWAVTSNFHMFSGQWHNHFIKPLFGILLFLISQGGEALGLNIMDAARAIFFINSIFIVFLFFKLSQKITKDQWLAALCTFILVSCSYFWERSFRVRSDLLTLTIYLLVLNLIYSPQVWTLQRRLLCLLLMVLNTFITAKSILLLVMVSSIYRSQLFPHKIRGKKTMAVFVLLVISFLIFSNKEAVFFYINSFGYATGEIPYFHGLRWEHVLRFLNKNIWLYFFLILPVLSQIFCKSFSDNKKFFNLCSLIFVWVLVHPNRFPFFLYSLLPFLLLAILNNRLVKKIINFDQKNFFATGCTLVFILGLSYFALKRAAFVFYDHNNKHQKKFQSEICTQLKSFPQAKVLDPVGVCPLRKNSYFWFFGPSSKNKSFVKNIIDYKVDIILLTTKTRYLQPELNIATQDDYFHLPQGILVRALNFDNSDGFLTRSLIELELASAFHSAGGANLVKLRGVKNNLGPDYTLPENFQNLSFQDRSHLTKNLQNYISSNKDSLSFIKNYKRIKVSPFQLGSVSINKTMNSLFRNDSEL